MAGHSKWANIRFRKGAQDAKRGKIFTKLIREITVAARMGGGDSAANARLRTAIDKGLGQNMPKDKIERAIKKGTGELEGESFEEVVYEGYGPNGVAVMVECATDNKNRTVSEVRHAFSKHGGNLGTDGSVAYLFTKTGVLSYPAGSNEDAIMEAALEAGAEDIVTDEDGSIEVTTTVEDFHAVVDAMTVAGHQPERSEIAQRASTETALDEAGAEKMLKLLDVLEDLDDVQNVYSNADFPDSVLQEQAG
jgi:YebC/PmpR family DNA-binding regulatory protein